MTYHKAHHKVCLTVQNKETAMEPENDSFYIGAVVGAVLWLACMTVVWHIGESLCQTDLNVADCTMRVEFVPIVK